MKEKTGWVYITPKGKYLRRSETTTHTGLHVHWTTVDDLNEADIFMVPKPVTVRCNETIPKFQPLRAVGTRKVHLSQEKD